MTIRLGIVDDHPMVTDGLDAALRTIGDLEVVARGRTVTEARELLARDDLDVVLLDVRLEDGNGIQALSERGPRSRPAVLVISSFKTSQHVAAAARFGAAGFLLKTVALPTLVEAIRAVHSGGSVFTQEQLQKGFVTLSPRERQIVALAMDGLSNKEIGTRLELSFKAAEEGWLDIEPPVAAVGGPPR